jgi:hypothetical protein
MLIHYDKWLSSHDFLVFLIILLLRILFRIRYRILFFSYCFPIKERTTVKKKQRKERFL